MNYKLTTYDIQGKEKLQNASLIKRFWKYLDDDRLKLFFALSAILINAIANIAAPFLVGYTIDHYIQTKNLEGVALFSLILTFTFIIVFITNYLQTLLMGRIGQDVLFRLRNALFAKVQSLPLAFFNQNKLGDLISRINSDTDKLNQFFSQSLIQFIGNVFTIIGIGIFIFFINIPLAAVTLSTAFFLLIVMYFLSPWINKQNRLSLQSLGGLSAEIQESLNNFKVIVSFDRRDYFRENFFKANENNFHLSVRSGIANTISSPLFDFAGNAASLLVLAFGIMFILQGNLTIGILVSFISYTDKFYSPLRQIASGWSSAQLALAAWNRISEILELETDMPILAISNEKESPFTMEFADVSFDYSEEKKVLQNVSFAFEVGKTYAIVGPTGGGKSTIASLMARLYDPKQGVIYYKGKDIRSYLPADLTNGIGFILQDQFLFTGSVGENIAYGNKAFASYTKEALLLALKDRQLDSLLDKFESGLDTPITPATESISHGQKQLISFMRAILRNPSLLIMDEATANIDTVTEGLLQDIIDKLPETTTKVIIAHRMNTIKNADEIFFVNNGIVQSAGSFENSLDLIMQSKRNT